MFRTWTYSKEYPLQCLTVFITGGVKCELALLVVVRDKVDQDGSTLEYVEVATRVIDESGNTSIWIDLMRAPSSAKFCGGSGIVANHLEEPGLFLYILAEVNLLVRIVERRVRGLEFLKQDGRLWDGSYWQLSDSMSRKRLTFLPLGVPAV